MADIFETTVDHVNSTRLLTHLHIQRGYISTKKKAIKILLLNLIQTKKGYLLVQNTNTNTFAPSLSQRKNLKEKRKNIKYFKRHR